MRFLVRYLKRRSILDIHWPQRLFTPYETIQTVHSIIYRHQAPVIQVHRREPILGLRFPTLLFLSTTKHFEQVTNVKRWSFRRYKPSNPVSILVQIRVIPATHMVQYDHRITFLTT